MYTERFNILTRVGFLLDDNWDITGPGFAWHKFLISVISPTVTAKYLCFVNASQFLFMFTLKLKLLKLEHSQIWLWKHLGENGLQKFLLEWLSSSVSLRTTHMLQPACKGWMGHNSGWQHLQSVASIWIWHEFNHLLTKTFIQTFKLSGSFWVRGCSSAAVMDEPTAVST